MTTPSPTAHGTHDHPDDPRNAEILINVNGQLVPRGQAVVSVFDAGFVLGDGVWEGLRVHQGRFAFLGRHLDRLFEGAKAIAMDIGLSREELERRLYETLDANRVEANYDKGVLTVSIPVAEAAKPRKVAVGASSGSTAAIDTSSSAN